MFKKFDVVHACDFDTIIPSYIVAKIKRKKIIYDIFDFYADMLSLPKPITNFIAWLDKKFINRVDAVILADEHRISQIAPAKPKKITSIYNIPETDENTLKKLRNTKTRDNYYFYAGSLNKDRMLEETIEVFSKNNKLELDIAGWGPLSDKIKKMAEKFTNINFLGKISYEEVLKKTAQTSAVIAFYDPSIKNNRLASPNKLFEAISLGKAVITNKRTLMAKYVRDYGLGLTINYGQKTELEKALLANDKQSLQKHTANCRKAYKDKFNWNIMKLRLLKLYEELY